MSEKNVGVTALNASNLAEIAVDDSRQIHLETPGYDRSKIARSIVHLGVGGFHRAHLAAYVDELCRSGNLDWGIVGAGILPGDQAMAEALQAQNTLYTLIVRGPERTETRVVGSLLDYIHAHPDPERLIEAIADPATKIVSMTITEGGYPVNDETGEFDPDSPVAGADSVFGILAAALGRRRDRDGGPLSIVSCDNIVSNGTFARKATLGEVTRFDPNLTDWVQKQVGFPNSMVDRITPATTDGDRAWLVENAGIEDRWPVVTEPFTQWVVEDHFAAERPPLEDLGVIITDDVEPYERMKLQLLNAGHSCLAYVAALVGHEHVHTAMADAALAHFLNGFFHHEAAPVLPPVADIDLEEYQRSLIERFSNPAIADQIARLCLDGSAKFPKFLLPTVRAQLAAGGPVECSALALAGWCRYLQGTAEDGSTITPSPDPQLEEAVAHAQAADRDPARFLDFTDVFGEDLPADDRFVTTFTDALISLKTKGVVASVNSVLGQSSR